MTQVALLRNESILAGVWDQYIEIIFIDSLILPSILTQPHRLLVHHSEFIFKADAANSIRFQLKDKVTVKVALFTPEGAFGCVTLPPTSTPT